jgi:hypothetical protein
MSMRCYAIEIFPAHDIDGLTFWVPCAWRSCAVSVISVRISPHVGIA